MQILVHDSRFVPRDSDRFPRWIFQRGEPRHRLTSGWSQADGGFQHRQVEHVLNVPDGRLDWLIYRHWQPRSIATGQFAITMPTMAETWAPRMWFPDLALEARGRRCTPTSK